MAMTDKKNNLVNKKYCFFLPIDKRPE